MRKLILLGLIALFILSSCSKDDVGEILKAVELAIPADKTTVKLDITTLSWKKNLDFTAKYDVYISKTAEYNAESLFKTNYFETSVVSPKLEGNILYHWKVVVKNVDGEKAESKEFTFKTALFAPIKPELLLPKENLNTKEKEIKLVWSKNKLENVEYSVFLGKTKKLTDVNIIKTGLKETSFTATKLEEGVTYFWKIQVSPAAYSQPVSSEIFSFSSGNQLPTVPVLTYPRDGMMLAPTSLNLLWDRSTDLDKEKIVYDIYLDDDKTFSDERNIEKNFDGKKITYVDLNYNTVYYWKVIARDEQGAEISSKVCHFTTCQDPNTVLLLPADNYNDKYLKELTWEVKEGFKYQVMISNTEGFSEGDIRKKDLIEGKFLLTNLDSDVKYFWKIVAFDTAGNSFETASRNFTIKRGAIIIKDGDIMKDKDREYKTVIINGVEWMAENFARIPDMKLACTGWLIPGEDPRYVINKVTNIHEITNPVYKSIDNVKGNKNYIKYGILYSIDLIKTMIPAGWHLPLDFEWNNMEQCFGASLSVLEEIGYRGTHAPALESKDYTENINGKDIKWIDATNESRFSAIPGGFGDIDMSNYVNLKLIDFSKKAYFWTASKRGKQVCRILYNNYKYKGVKLMQLPGTRAMSVRLIKGVAPVESAIKGL
jgi:uncharacterized protein (TIGR02145 family)